MGAVTDGGPLLRWFHWRIRTLMVVIAIAALLAAFEEMWRRGERYDLIASEFESDLRLVTP